MFDGAYESDRPEMHQVPVRVRLRVIAGAFALAWGLVLGLGVAVIYLV